MSLASAVGLQSVRKVRYAVVAEEGLADLRVIEGLLEALKTGRAVTPPPFERHRHIDPQTRLQTLPRVHPPEPVNASSPARG